MSSLPPSSTPPAGDDSVPESLPVAATAPESASAAAAESSPESTPAAGPAPEDSGQTAAAAAARSDSPPATRDDAVADTDVDADSDADADVGVQADIDADADADAHAEANGEGEAGSGDAASAAKPAPGAPVEDCGPQLKQLYPALFSNPPKPLKLRIQADIQARSPGQFTKPQLSAFLRRYTGGHGYLNAMVKATHRFDLDGNPGDALSDEHRQAAVDELARRRTNTQARRALEDEQRFNRSVLLRDFEQTKLDKTGFAALKGVPEGELDGLLDRARKEAAETPPPAANRDRRGPRPDAPRGPREDRGQGPRPPRPARAPRDASVAAAGEAPAGDAAAPQGARPDAPRGPRNDAPRGPRNDAPRGGQGPRSDAPRGPQGPRSDAPRGPQAGRPDGPRGPRPDGQRGPRADGPRGPRPDGPRGPRDDRQRDDRPRGPRPDDARGPRPNVSSTPAMPTAMALAFSTLRGAKSGAPAADAPKPASTDKSDK